jgi:CheY-like chemotaxis protein
LPATRMDTNGAGERVIVTDDDVDLADSLAELLRFELPPAVAVVVARDGLEAIDEVLRAPQPPVVVLDLSMPGLTGLETASAIRRSSSTARDAVLIAVSGDDELLENARRSGFFKMVQRKPIDFGALLRLLKTLLPTHRLKRR